MKLRFLALALALVASALSAEEAPKLGGASVMPGQLRLESLRSAEQLIAERATTWRESTPGLVDPFFRVVSTSGLRPGVAETAGKPAKVRSSDDALALAATKIAPTGTMLVGDEPFLLISGKRYRVSDEIPVTIEGSIYAVRIASIERNTYTLRLDDKELRREFK